MTVERQSRGDERVSPPTARSSSGDVGPDIQRNLESGESLLWAGRPRQGVILRGSDVFAIPFSLLWCGFAIVWEAMAFRANSPFFFRLWGIPFVLMGLYIVLGRFIADAMGRARTTYAVTDRRVIIATSLIRTNVRSLYLRGLAEINLSESKRGRGTITFGPASGMQTMMIRGWPGAGKSLPPAFEGIDRAAQVLEIIRKAQSES